MTSRTNSVAVQREPELLGQTVVVIGGSALVRPPSGSGLNDSKELR
jgi:hypothetical protein